MSFLATGSGLVNSEYIVKLDHVLPHKHDAFLATLHDGSTVRLTGGTDAIQTALLPIIAAAPGFRVAIAIEDGTGAIVDIETSEIVGWRIQDYLAPTPITCNGAEELSGPKAVITPSGKVWEWQNEREAQNIDEWQKMVTGEAVAKALSKQREKEAVS